MTTTLANEQLQIQVKHLGAELSSLVKKSTQTEYLWQADPIFWGRHAPILFPIVGRLKKDEFSIGEQFYNMKQHGLARNLAFELIKTHEAGLTFELTHSQATLKQYPFPFRLRIEYALYKDTLIVAYQVFNPGNATMYFSIGGHPAFRCPLQEGEKRSDYQLVFSETETAFTQRLTEGIRNGEKELILDNQQHLPITDSLFEKDALIFENLTSDRVQLQKGNQTILAFNFSGFPYLGIWSKSEQAPFICIEPWFGVADHIVHNQQFSSKEGILKLEAQETFECAYSIEV